MTKLQIALDGMTDMSRRRYDVNGFLHVDGCHVAKEMVYPYTGDELAELEGIDPDGVYYVLLPAETIKRALKTFEGLPLLLDHHDESAEAIRRIESGEQREISIGFFATYDKRPGVYDDQPYDFVMSRLVGNHVALVPEGRAGHDVLVADSANGFSHWLKTRGLARTVKNWPRS